MLKKILFFAEGQLGDSLVLIPALRATRNALPEAKITVLLFYRSKYFSGEHDGMIRKSERVGAAEIFAGSENVDEVLEIDRKRLRSLKGFRRLRSELSCVRYLRKHKFNAAVCTFPEDRFVIWSFLAGIKIRIGQKKQSFGFLLTHRPHIDERSNEGVLKYFCGLIEELGIKCKDYSPYYEVPQDAVRWAEDFFKENKIVSNKVIAIHPGARDRDRQLPPSYYSEIINGLNGINVVLCFGDFDNEYVREIKPPRRKFIPVKTESVSKLAALFRKSDLCIVQNSGPRHLAAAAGAKTLGLLEKHDHIMWKIYEGEDSHFIFQSDNRCSYCEAHGARPDQCLGKIPPGAKYGSYCMHDIKPEKVIKKIESILR